MSRDKTKGRERPRFTPSRQDIAIYKALQVAQRPLSTQDFIEQGCASAPTVRHTCQWWTEQGLLKRIFLDRIAWYEWAPAERAKELARLLAEAVSVYERTPPLRSVTAQRAPTNTNTDPVVAQVLRAFSKLLADAADKYEGK